MSEVGLIASFVHAVIAGMLWGRWEAAIFRSRSLRRANIPRLTLGATVLVAVAVLFVLLRTIADAEVRDSLYLGWYKVMGRRRSESSGDAARAPVGRGRRRPDRSERVARLYARFGPDARHMALTGYGRQPVDDFRSRFPFRRDAQAQRDRRGGGRHWR